MMFPSEFTIRDATEKDISSIIEVRRIAILEKAGSHYDQQCVDLWAAGNDSDDREERLKQQINSKEWLSLVAEDGNNAIGFGQVNFLKNILGAVYVRQNPYGRVGTLILKQLVSCARGHKVAFLEMESSMNAEAFYKVAGFRALGYEKHIMRPSGVEMACVKMRIDL